MKKVIVSAVLGLLLTFTSSPATIRTVDRMEMIESTVTSSTLLIFDIDETLVYFPEMIASPKGFRLVCRRFNELLQAGVDSAKVELWRSIILVHSPPALIEPDLLARLDRWRQRGIEWMALTRRQAGRFGVIEDAGDFLLSQLKDLGLQFTFLHDAHSITLEGRCEQCPATSLFQGGCLFAALNSKGPILGEFFDAIDHKPGKVVFVDNRLPQVESVSAELNRRGIDNVCFHYCGAETLDVPFDEEAVNRQLQHLIEHDEWIPVEEARRSLEPLSTTVRAARDQ